MLHRRKDQTSCWDVYPVEEQTQTLESNATVLVDIGGNLGQQCAEFKKKCPKAPGRVVNQDLPGPIDAAQSTPGVENMVHDMFTPQPIESNMRDPLRPISLIKVPLINAQELNSTTSEPFFMIGPTLNVNRFSKTSFRLWVQIQSS